MVVAALIFSLCALAQPAGTRSRSVKGTVKFTDGEPVRGAAVQLQDMLTLNIRSFLTQKGGGYHFEGLYSNVDYQLRAEYHGSFGPKETLSRFDARKKVTIDLSIGAGR